MRYRKLDASGDMVFGGGRPDWLENAPEAVAQAVQTRLNLWIGEWFLDADEGTNWMAVLGAHTQNTRDWEIRTRILDTQGVTNIESYSSQVDPDTRKFSIQAAINTIYGQATVTV